MTQYSLGVAYYFGTGVARDYVEAAKWFRKASEQGEGKAQYNLGTMYFTGQGVTRNYDEAFKWYRKAAEQGEPKAQYHLAGMYQDAKGIKRSYGEALKWYRKAAEQGDTDAQRSLALMYAQGLGVSRNYVESYMWYSLGARQEDDSARKFLDSLEKNMTPDQISETQKRAAAWQPKGTNPFPLVSTPNTQSPKTDWREDIIPDESWRSRAIPVHPSQKAATAQSTGSWHDLLPTWYTPNSPVPVCAKKPVTGTILVLGMPLTGSHVVEIINGSNTDAIVKMRTPNDGLVLAFFVAKGTTAPISDIPDGNYLVQFAFGQTLREDCKAFTEISSANQLPGMTSLQARFTNDAEINSFVSFTLHSTPDGNIHPQRINVSDFER